MALNRDIWTGKGHNLLWSDAANWSSGVPASGQSVLFTGSASFTLDLTGVDPSIGEMTVTGDRLALSDARLDLDAVPAASGLTTDLLLDNAASLNLTNDAILSGTNFVQIGGAVKGTLTAGTLNVMTGSGGWSAGVNITDGTMTLNGGAWSPSGADGGGFDIFVGGPDAGALVISAGGTLTSDAAAGAEITIGANGAASGQALVTGPGSTLSIGNIYLAEGEGSGLLTVQNFATVETGGLSTGSTGSGTVLVSAHGVLEANDGIGIGSDLPPIDAALAITNHGSVYAGTNGLVLEGGTLTLDPTATLFGGIISLAGAIDAQPNASGAPGTVTLGQVVSLGDLDGLPQFGSITTAYSTGGAVLHFAGPVQGEANTVLAVSGTVELSSSGGAIGTVALGAGTLVIAANGALGIAGTLSFANAFTGATGNAALVIDKGVHFINAIASMAATDTIDLRGFAFGGGVTDTYANGKLTLKDSAGSTSLSVIGSFTASDFTFTQDQLGGTIIHL
jgi:T5SS/PEP-CTERM-associated repeat protein